MAGGDISSTAAGSGAPPQAGILEGVNPIAYTPSNPIALFIIQASHVNFICFPGTLTGAYNPGLCFVSRPRTGNPMGPAYRVSNGRIAG